MTTMCVLGYVTELGLKNAKAYCILAAAGINKRNCRMGEVLY